MRGVFRDRAGEQVGRWTVVRRAPTPAGLTAAHWLCRCACGVERVVPGGNLGRGSRGCGRCAARELGAARRGRPVLPPAAYVCRHCGASTLDPRSSGARCVNECARCERRRLRNGLGPDGRPAYVHGPLHAWGPPAPDGHATCEACGAVGRDGRRTRQGKGRAFFACPCHPSGRRPGQSLGPCPGAVA